MSAQTYSLCNRPAVWSIHNELFCEVNKEGVVDRFEIDHFPMYRLSEAEEQFIVRGRHRHKQPVQSVLPPDPNKSPNPKAK